MAEVELSKRKDTEGRTMNSFASCPVRLKNRFPCVFEPAFSTVILLSKLHSSITIRLYHFLLAKIAALGGFMVNLLLSFFLLFIFLFT